MGIEKLEAEVLALPADSQAILLARLLEKLGQNVEIEQEVASNWVEEAERRDLSMEKEGVVGIPAEEVFKRFGNCTSQT
ncbi:MAG: addiction module protein [Scytonematopsis contorta HA4267-MV1]|jgi:hypothetical protein|nr:addiction module protein [Scytonematopsis contorta HA4267-MV1]